MSLRGTYVAAASPNSSPSPSPTPTFSGSSAPLPVPGHTSPSRVTDRKHREQLASYKGGKPRSNPARRWSPLQTAWNATRRLSGVLEESEEEAKARRLSGQSRSTVLSLVGSGSILHRRSKVRTYLLYLATVFLVYYVLLRPILSDASGIPSTSTASVGPNVRKKVLAPMRHRRHRPATHASRAPLPPGVVLRTSINHPVDRGLLKVDMNSKVHPIYQLIRDARETWDDKLEKQSRTLQDAVKEYRRRYGRQPPKGFDRWWKFVVDNNIQMPDEYDQIDRDLLPFRALSPQELNRRIEHASLLPATYTLRVKHGSLRTSVTNGIDDIHGAKERLEGQAALIAPIAKELGDFTVVYSVHDTASVVISYNHRRDLLEHVDEEEYFDENEELDLNPRGWPAFCPANSAINSARGVPEPFNLASHTRSSYTFIADLYRSMDVCDHPEYIPLHGVLAGKNPHAEALTPLFSLSKTTLHADVLGVPVEQYVDGMRHVPWEDKNEDRLLWRGSNTGIHYAKDTPWRETHRMRMIKLANEQEGEVELLSPPRALEGKTVGKARAKLPVGEANKFYMDMAFTGQPIQCDHADGTCQELSDEYRFTGRMTHDAALHYKYVVDVDGNAWSARFQRLLSSGSLIFKSTMMPEWWTDRIQPWVHYVPIQVDYSDLYDTVAFFRGNTSSLGGEPALAREIAEAGREWAHDNWRRVDMTAYVFRLYLEWARLLAPKRGEEDFVFEEWMERERA